MRKPFYYRPRGGLSLFSALLALAIFGVVIVSVGRQLETWAFEERQRQAGEQLGTLFTAAWALAAPDFALARAHAAASAGGISEVSLADLRSGNLLPAGFHDVNAVGQGYRIFRRAVGTDGLEILVTTVTPPGAAPVFNLVAPLQHTDTITLGVVSPVETGKLKGPGVDLDISAYQTHFPGVLRPGELAAVDTITLRGLVGSVLHRVEIAGHPTANTMETTLDMGGNAIEGAGSVEVMEIEVAEDIRALGGMEVMQGLMVGQGVNVQGDTTITGSLEATSAQITGTLEAGAAVVAGLITAGQALVSGAATMDTLGVSGSVTATSLTADTVSTRELDTRAAGATTLTTQTTQTGLLNVTGTATAGTAAVTSLLVGSCSGC